MHICLSAELMDISQTDSQHSDQEQRPLLAPAFFPCVSYGNWINTTLSSDDTH